MAKALSVRAVIAVLFTAALVLPALPVEALRSDVDKVQTGLATNVNLYAVSWKPTGSEAVVVGDGQTLLAYKDSTGSFRKVDASSAPQFLLGAAWKPDSTFALVVGSSGTVGLFNGQTLTNVDTGTTGFFYDVKWAPDGTEAILVGAGGIILRYVGGAFVSVASGTDKNLNSVSFDPRDGSALVVGTNSTFLRVDPGGTVTKLPFEGDRSLYCVAWNPAGTVAVITGANGIIATYDGTSVVFINKDTPNAFLGACWKPDGAEALICGDTSIILRLRDGRLNVVPTGVEGPSLHGIAFRPDGSYLLTVGFKALCFRYPRKPVPKQPGLLDNPFVLGGIVAVVVAAFAFVAYYEWRDRQEIPPKKGRAGERARSGKKRRR